MARLKRRRYLLTVVAADIFVLAAIGPIVFLLGVMVLPQYPSPILALMLVVGTLVGAVAGWLWTRSLLLRIDSGRLVRHLSVWAYFATWLPPIVAIGILSSVVGRASTVLLLHSLFTLFVVTSAVHAVSVRRAEKARQIAIYTKLWGDKVLQEELVIESRGAGVRR